MKKKHIVGSLWDALITPAVVAKYAPKKLFRKYPSVGPTTAGWGDGRLSRENVEALYNNGLGVNNPFNRTGQAPAVTYDAAGRLGRVGDVANFPLDITTTSIGQPQGYTIMGGNLQTANAGPQARVNRAHVQVSEDLYDYLDSALSDASF